MIVKFKDCIGDEASVKRYVYEYLMKKYPGFEIQKTWVSGEVEVDIGCGKAIEVHVKGASSNQIIGDVFILMDSECVHGEYFGVIDTLWLPMRDTQLRLSKEVQDYFDKELDGKVEARFLSVMIPGDSYQYKERLSLIWKAESDEEGNLLKLAEIHGLWLQIEVLIYDKYKVVHDGDLELALKKFVRETLGMHIDWYYTVCARAWGVYLCREEDFRNESLYFCYKDIESTLECADFASSGFCTECYPYLSGDKRKYKWVIGDMFLGQINEFGMGSDYAGNSDYKEGLLRWSHLYDKGIYSSEDIKMSAQLHLDSKYGDGVFVAEEYSKMIELTGDMGRSFIVPARYADDPEAGYYAVIVSENCSHPFEETDMEALILDNCWVYYRASTNELVNRLKRNLSDIEGVEIKAKIKLAQPWKYDSAMLKGDLDWNVYTGYELLLTDCDSILDVVSSLLVSVEVTVSVDEDTSLDDMVFPLQLLSSELFGDVYSDCRTRLEDGKIAIVTKDGKYVADYVVNDEHTAIGSIVRRNKE